MFLSSAANLPHLLTRVLFRLMLPCVVLLSGAVMCAHGQAAVPASLPSLLLPAPGCSAPCFLGIRPGQTTLTAGLEQLRTSPVIQSLTPVPAAPGSSASPGLYDVVFAQSVASMHPAQIQFVTEARTGIIDSILLMNSGLQLSDITLTLGQPASLILDNRFHTGLVTYAAFYPQDQMYVQMVLPVCSPEVATMLTIQQNVLVGIETPSSYAAQRSLYPADVTPESGWLQQLHDLKRTDCA